ncbi:T9SS type B sorting domain-containing protein [Portibacter lacus]|uniref:PKD domain-containing protein n=1 Tax=Portibacter lacus TaxID=1099794 RepID=A0AA37STB8_9BACT|nr:gliding motility-associated C-terminal domain-containing protein [Portibacter lacus]GLR17645.1 hypothetical protein GCM10007940_22600 [Portibacter lacus]
MKKGSLVIVVFFMSMYLLQGQSTNVDCASAFEIVDPSNYCSGDTEFSSEDVGSSGLTVPACWGDVYNDLWFTFVARSVSINISVDGTFQEDNLEDVKIVLLKGDDCGNITETGACIEDGRGAHLNQIFFDGLSIGERYYIVVDSRRNAGDGVFKICTQGYNSPVVPGKDCGTAAILCNKEPFVVQYVEGEGLDGSEADDACLLVGENNSSWFKFRCAVAGSLTFEISPTLKFDDYDFALYELTNGLENCEKTLLRCVASDGGEDSSTGQVTSCGATTGLDLTSVDLEEDSNCEIGEDGFAQFINMEVGKSYVLIINNFSDSDSGFNIEFGGTGEFEGPQADFQVAIDECGSGLIIEDESFDNVSNITDYEWDFGQGATPEEGTGPGPFNISYDEYGSKSITLKITTELGCQVYVTKDVDLIACGYLDSLTLELDSIGHIGCGGAADGYLAVSPSAACEPFEYNIDGGPFQPTAIFENLTLGDHTIGIRSIGGACMKDTTFTIIEGADFTVDAGEDIVLTDPLEVVDLSAITDAMGDVTVTWSPEDLGLSCSDGSTNCLNPSIRLPIDLFEITYTVTVTDANGCSASDEINISVDLCSSSSLGISIDSIRSVTCSGLSTGYIAVSGTDGVPDYEYNINDEGYTSNPVFEDLPSGSYFIVVRDAFNCEFGTVVDITEVPDFNIDAGDDISLSFPGNPATPLVTTDAVGINEIIWEPSEFVICADGSTNCLNPTITVTETTDFNVTITDENGCVKSDMITIFVPDVCTSSDLAVQIDSIRDDYCNGALGSYVSVSGLGGFPDYQYNIDNGSFSDDSIFENLAPGDYVIGIQDRFNCVQNLTLTINSIPGFIANAGDDVTINGSEPFDTLSGSHNGIGNVTVSWSPPNGIMCPDGTLNCLSPQINPEITTTYTMTVFDELGCSAIDEVRVIVVENTDIYMPNIFSPNDDGVNDYFSILSDPTIVESIEKLVIFDRWGNMVYSGSNLLPNDETGGWDGSVNGVLAEQGVYTWFAEIRYISRPDGDPVTVSGDLTLLR